VNNNITLYHTRPGEQSLKTPEGVAQNHNRLHDINSDVTVVAAIIVVVVVVVVVRNRRMKVIKVTSIIMTRL
jgi:hypothetical protein